MCVLSIVNIDNKIGAVGFLSRVAPFVYPVTLVKVDPHTGEHMRGRDGVCLHVRRAGESSYYVLASCIMLIFMFILRQTPLF